jgi:hypothetical protein
MGHISFLLNAGVVNLVGDNIDTIKKTLMDANKEVGLKINIGKAKYQHITLASRLFEDVTVQIFGGNSNKSKFDSGGN